jgi:chorismate dehydratase
LLFSNRLIKDLDAATVGITEQSSTSVLLLKLLFEEKYSIFPSKYLQEKSGDAWLVIGDDALREKKKKSYSYMYDLGEEWWLWQNLPFVFARWVVRKNLPSNTKENLYNIVKISLHKNLENLDIIASSMAKKYSVLSEEEILNYLQGFTYSIGNIEDKSMNIFQSLLSQQTI